MGKGDKRGRLKPLPDIKSVTARKARGRQRMAQIQGKPDAAMLTVLSARVARGAADMDAARDPIQGSDMGRCIAALCSGDDLRNVKHAWASMLSTWETYCTRILCIKPGPQCSSITVTPDPMQTDPSFRVDVRSPAEKDADAKRSWREWSSRIAALDRRQHRDAIRRAMDGTSFLWHDRAPTADGRVAVAAVRMLAV